jgi:hypothetical protein
MLQGLPVFVPFGQLPRTFAILTMESQKPESEEESNSKSKREPVAEVSEGSVCL